MKKKILTIGVIVISLASVISFFDGNEAKAQRIGDPDMEYSCSCKYDGCYESNGLTFRRHCETASTINRECGNSSICDDSLTHSIGDIIIDPEK